MSTDTIKALDDKIRRLRSELDGVPGAVLREVDPQKYEHKHQQLQLAMREYYHAFYGDRVSMP